MLSLTIHGPTTATIVTGGHRILLGTAQAPAGDPSVVVLNRTSVEDAARLPRIIRDHNKHAGKPTIVTGDAKRLGELLRTDEVCQATVHGKPMDISLESYAAVTEVPGAGTSLGIYRAEGFGIFVDRCGWTRDDDALRTWLYLWDPQGEHVGLIEQALFKADQDKMSELNRLEQAVTDELVEASKQLQDGKQPDPESLPKPVMRRYLWAPFCREPLPGFAHMTLTMRRAPYDAGSPQQRASFPRSRCIEDFIGKELQL